MIVSSEKKVEILNDHYKDTCSRLANYRKQRNRLVLYALIIMGIAALFELSPQEALSAIFAIFSSKVGSNIKSIPIADIPVSNSVIKALPYLIIICIAITYRHYTIAIDNQYSYIQMLESELTSLYPRSNLFTRETNYSSRGSRYYAMWSSRFYDLILSAICFLLVGLGIVVDIAKDGFHWRQAISGILLISFVLLTYKRCIKLPWIGKHRRN